MGSLLLRRRAMMLAAAPADPWDTLFASIAAGTYATNYAIGDTLPLSLGTQGIINAQIAAFDADVDENGNTIPVTFVAQYLLTTSHRWNPARAGESGNYTLGTGTIGGYEYSELRSWILSTVFPLFPSKVSARIVAAKKVFSTCDTAGTIKKTGTYVYDKTWALSNREIYGNTALETNNPTYSTYFSNRKVRRKTENGTATEWWTRSANVNSVSLNANSTSTNGSAFSRVVTNKYGVLIGFCIR